MPLFQHARTGAAVYIDPNDLAAGATLSPQQLSQVRHLTMVYLHRNVGLSIEDVARVMGRQARTVKQVVRNCISAGPLSVPVEADHRPTRTEPRRSDRLKPRPLGR